jgi:hypothetical protein
VDASQHLIQILLPVTGNEGTPFGAEPYAITRQELTDTFGGLTAYLRAPARGVWKQDDGDEARDDIVIFEVMSDSLDAAWWRTYRRRLEERFRQDVIVIRAMPATIL